LGQNELLPFDEELKSKPATPDFCHPNLLPLRDPNENKTKSTFKPTKVAKYINHGSKVVKKELPKSTSNWKKERSAKGKKPYIEDDDHQDIEEVEMTGSRKLLKCIKRILTIN
jgi:hypothetical protein